VPHWHAAKGTFGPVCLIWHGVYGHFAYFDTALYVQSAARLARSQLATAASAAAIAERAMARIRQSQAAIGATVWTLTVIACGRDNGQSG
jgi:hypothetical protein